MVARREKSGEKVTLEFYFSETAYLPINQYVERINMQPKWNLQSEPKCRSGNSQACFGGREMI